MARSNKYTPNVEFYIRQVQDMANHRFTPAQAETAANDFINVYWDANRKYFYCNRDRKINPDHAVGPDGGLYTDYWWEAQLWETVMDIYERTGSTVYKQMIDDVYTEFLTEYPAWYENEFNDDIGWWALASIRAYNVLGDTKYLALSQAMFDFIFTQWSDDYGGGIWWNRIDFLPQKNVATNGTAAITALKLSYALKDTTYLDRAYALYKWVRQRLYNPETGRVYDNIAGDGDGEVVAWEYTYNFGIFSGASFAFFEHTGDSQYLVDAQMSVKWVVANMTLDDTTLLYEGIDDTPGFKMIFCRFVKHIADTVPVPEYQAFLTKNATQAWNHRRDSDGIIGHDWTITPSSDSIQSLAAAAGVSILNLAQPDGFVGIVMGTGQFETENAVRVRVDNENTHTGYSGRGYNAGWNAEGTGIVIAVNESVAGIYTLAFRYSAAAGKASRTLYVNGIVADTALTFSGTSDWDVWDTISTTVTLDVGTNLVSVMVSADNGNVGYLNLDYMHVTPR